MPVIAESPPLIYDDGTEDPTPTLPSLTQPLPIVIPPANIIRTPPACNLADILKNHKIFIDHVDLLDTCFKRDAMPEFTDRDFELHKDLAIMDKYITVSGDHFCSMQSLENLSRKLYRLKD